MAARLTNNTVAEARGEAGPVILRRAAKPRLEGCTAAIVPRARKSKRHQSGRRPSRAGLRAAASG